MKRYRITNPDFDTRARILATTIENHWEERVKQQWRSIKEGITVGLARTFGPATLDQKRKNLVDLGSKPFSVIAFHNAFLEQIRVAFVSGTYYPALTGACALGERVLNHTIIRLRDKFRHTPEYKRIHRKSSFGNWDVPIDTLESWSILLPDAAESMRALKEIRNRVIHFDPATDVNDRPLALEAIHTLSQALEKQFGAFGSQPWFIRAIPGEAYLTKESETWPFVEAVYVPNAVLVGPYHSLEAAKDGHLVVRDDHQYEDSEVTDDEFRELRLSQKKS